MVASYIHLRCDGCGKESDTAILTPDHCSDEKLASLRVSLGHEGWITAYPEDGDTDVPIFDFCPNCAARIVPGRKPIVPKHRRFGVRSSDS